MKEKKILLCGAYTYGNQGDDAIKSVITQTLTDLGAEQIIVTRPYPDESLVLWADVVIVGGGGLIYDQEQEHFRYFFEQYCGWAIKYKKKLIFCGIGFQHVKNLKNIALLRDAFEYCSFASVRQRADVGRIKFLGINKDVEVIDDPAFIANPVSHYSYSNPKSPSVCFIPHMGSDINNLVWAAKSCVDLGYDVHIAVTSYEDIPIAEKLNGQIHAHDSIRVFKYLSFGEVIHLLHRMDVVITSRFHGIVFSYNINYEAHPKVFVWSNAYKIINQVSEEDNLYDEIKKRDLIGFHKKITEGGHGLVAERNATDIYRFLQNINQL